MSSLDRTFIGGNRNPHKFGLSLRESSGTGADPEMIPKTAKLLRREPFFVDSSGYENEIIAASVHPSGNRIVYVESRAKELAQSVDIAIKIHLTDSSGHNESVDIESYNPFFGCDVGLLEWFDDELALLIYTEKHWTFAYRLGDCWPPQFAKIEERWMILGATLYYMGYKAESVQRLDVPSLTLLTPLSLEDAESRGCVPPDPYASKGA